MGIVPYLIAGAALMGLAIGLGLWLGHRGGTVNPLAPANTVAPTISGDGTTSGTLTGTTGTWTNSPTFAYLWYADGVSTGVTTSAYTKSGADDGKTFRRRVAATANGFTTYAFSSNSIAVGDVTAPTLSSPTDAANGSTGASISVSTNEGNGTLYWYISTSATPPSAAALKAGTGAVVSGNQAVSGTGVQNASPTGLTASTAYYTYFLHRDAAGNDSTIAAADGFTTDAPADYGTGYLYLSGPIGNGTSSTGTVMGDLLSTDTLTSLNASLVLTYVSGTTWTYAWSGSGATTTAVIRQVQVSGPTLDSTVAVLGTLTGTALTKTTDVGGNPMEWTANHDSTNAGVGDYQIMRWRLDGGSWTEATERLITSDVFFDMITDTDTYIWTDYIAAAPFATGAVLDVQQGYRRVGNATKVWGSSLTDTMAAGGIPTVWGPKNDSVTYSESNSRFKGTSGATGQKAISSQSRNTRFYCEFKVLDANTVLYFGVDNGSGSTGSTYEISWGTPNATVIRSIIGSDCRRCGPDPPGSETDLTGSQGAWVVGDDICMDADPPNNQVRFRRNAASWTSWFTGPGGTDWRVQGGAWNDEGGRLVTRAADFARTPSTTPLDNF